MFCEELVRRCRYDPRTADPNAADHPGLDELVDLGTRDADRVGPGIDAPSGATILDWLWGTFHTALRMIDYNHVVREIPLDKIILCWLHRLDTEVSC
jgi:hypothetical protein